MKHLLYFCAFWSGLAFAGETKSQVWEIRFFEGWGPERAVLLTGFGPFGDVLDNPSGRIVRPLKAEIERRCSQHTGQIKGVVLPVVPGVIDGELSGREDTVISVGVAESSLAIRIETAAQNYYYDPYTKKGGAIDPTMPASHVIYGPRVPDTIPNLLEGFDVVRGNTTSAGTYVCNDTYYRLILKKKDGYFVHIPNVAPTADGRLTLALGEIACRVFDK